MAKPVAVDYDPFEGEPQPVDYDPFSTEPVAVDYDPFEKSDTPAKLSLFKRLKAAAKNVLTGDDKSYAPSLQDLSYAPPADAIQARIEEARTRDTPISRTARKEPKPATREEAAAAVDRLKLDDDALAALLNPDAPDAVTGDDIRVKRVADYELANKFISNRKVLEGLKPTLTPKPLDTTAKTDASAAGAKPIQPAQAIPAVTLEPKPLKGTTVGDAATVAVAKPADPEEAKLQERAQTLAEAIPSFAKGAVKGVTAGLVDPTNGTEGAPGALGQIGGNLAGGLVAGLTGPVGAPAFLMTQFLTDLKERGMDPAKMADPEILALAATSGLFGGLMPVAFGKGVVTRALTGAGLGAAQNVAEEDIMAQITDTEPERLKQLILGGAFGAGFGAAFRDNPKVREAVEAKLKPEEVKVLDEVIDETLPPRAEEDVAAAMGEAPRADKPVAAEITPESPPAAEIGAETPVVEQPVAGAAEAPITVAPEVPPEGAAIPAAPAEAINVPTKIEEPAAPERPAAAGAPKADRAEAQRLWREKKTESPYFKKWFGESKVVDEEGKPKVVYHKTTENFDAFDPESPRGGEVVGHYFSGGNEGTVLDTAEKQGLGESTYPVYLDIKNPANQADVDAAYKELGNPKGAEGQNAVTKSLKEKGFDGIINPDYKGTEYVVFDPKQIKSATGNTGEFNPKNPSITDSHPGKPFGSTPEGVVRAPEPDERYTSARKEWTTTQRERMGISEIPSPTRREWETALGEAKEKNLDAEAETLAKVIIETPRALNDVETAGMVIRMERLVQQHEAALDNLSTAKDPVVIAEQSRALREIEGQFDTISKAVRYSGTEKGRNLAAQKLTINKNYGLVHVLSRAKAAKGKEITPEERTRLTEITKQLKDTETRLADAESRIRDLRARDAIKERRTSTKRTKPEVKAQIADLTEKTRRLLRAGCLTS